MDEQIKSHEDNSTNTEQNDSVSTESKPASSKKPKSGPIGIIVGVIIVVIIFLFGVSYAFGRGSGNVVTETRDVSDFTKISLSGMGNLYLEQGDSESLNIEAEDNIIEKMDIRVENDTLKINYKRTGWVWNIWPTEDINFYVGIKDIEDIKISGSGSMNSESLTFESLELDISGSGNADLTVNGTSIDSNVSGSGKFDLDGTITDQKVKISGSGKYFAKGLTSDTADVRISGSGTIELNVENELDVDISGSGKVRYLGSPEINQEISGSGSIEQLDKSEEDSEDVNEDSDDEEDDTEDDTNTEESAE